MKTTIQLSGLDCANCAAELEREIAKIDGVLSANLSFVNQKLAVEYANDETLKRVLFVANHFESVKVVETTKKQNERGRYATNSRSFKKQWWIIAFSSLLFLTAVLLEKIANGAGVSIARNVYYLAYLCVGYPVFISTGKNIAKGKIFDENFLMTVASVGAIFIGEVGEGVMVMLLYQVGETLQAMAVQSSRKSIAKLMDIKSEWATVLVPLNSVCDCGCEHDHEHHEHDHAPHAHHACDCGCEHDHEHHAHEHERHTHEYHTHDYQQKRVTPEAISIGDILLVKTGEKVAVDGVLIDENATLDTKSLTGESVLRECKQGEELLSGYINAGAPFKMQATHLFQDSAVSRILDLVENATAKKANPEKFITKFARIYTPIVCGLAILLAVFVPLVSGLITEQTLYFKDFHRWLTAALTFLVVSCPCALVISVPLTYFSGVGVAAKHGVLVKGATHLDDLAQVKTIAFDKTGTLTEGDFAVCGVHTYAGVSEKEVLSIAAGLEQNSAHPLAKAFAKYPPVQGVIGVQERAGQGMQGEWNGETILVGKAKFLQNKGVQVSAISSVHTVVYVAKNGVQIGAIEVGDKVRESAKSTMKALQKLGIFRSVMLTGDTQSRAKNIANEVGMYALNANLLPDEKVKKAEELKEYGTLAYVGDGINDAPVMAVADVSISMGKLGSAAAIEASDMVLVSDDLSALPKAVRIARKTRGIVMQNILFSIVMKVVFMALGVFNVLPLSLAVFADVGVMLLAVGNSARVRKISKN